MKIIALEKIQQRLSLMFALDLRSLALVRVLYGAILLFDIIDRSRYIKAFYTDLGSMPRSALLSYYDNPWFISLHLISGTWQFQAVLFIIAAIFAGMLLVGYKTKLATIISWFLLMSLQARNPLVLQGGDTLMRLGLFWAMFLPWGKYFSIDRVLALNKKQDSKKINNLYISGATIAYVLQIAFLYWFAAMFKTGPEWVKDWTAVYYALSIDQFTTYFGSFLLHFPILLKALTFSTLFVEAIFPFLFFMPFATEVMRFTGAISFIVLHLGFTFSMHLGPFPFVGMTTAAALLPGLFWKKIEGYTKKGVSPNITIYYDDGCGFCSKIINYIKVFLLIPAKNIIPGSKKPDIFSTMMKKNSWIVIDKNNNQQFKFEAFKAIAAASPILFLLTPILNLKSVSTFGNWLYENLAKHNKKLCPPLREIKEKKPSEKLKRFKTISLHVICILLISYVLLWNAMELSNGKIQAPFKNLALTLRLDQKWNMFAPKPLTEDGWYVIPGRLNNGDLIDVFKNGKPVSYAKPKRVSTTFDGERWRKYLSNLYNKNYTDYRLYYGQYLCRTWNENHDQDHQLLTFDIIYMLEVTLPDYQKPTITPTTLWQHHCF